MDLKERGIAVALLHPGYVRTEMVGGGGDVEPEEAAAGLIARMDELSLANTGSFWHAKGQELPW
jgi:NAD(P)-dependent dehydrogenase (short-subunit alcohol dehydrogenase family)